MTTFLDLIANETEAATRSKIIGFAQSAGLKITNWREGGIGQQILELTIGVYQLATSVISQAIRGYASLDTSTDPGDPDVYYPGNESLTPSAGFLSCYGVNTYGVERTDATFASGSVLFVNTGPTARTFAPGGLNFTWTVSPPSGAARTYHNVDDPAIYIGGYATVDVGNSLLLPVECDTIGSFGSCPSSSLSLTTSLLGCSGTNPDAIIGTDRQDAENYRTICRAASARLSLDGPSSAYEYLARYNLDGSPLYNAAVPPAIVGITRTWVSQDSSTGNVVAYYASATGAAIADDVTAANNNIESQAFAVPDAITFTGSAASELEFTVIGSAHIKNRPGLDSATVKQAIVDALVAAWPNLPLGGYDQTATEGYVYNVDIGAIVKAAYPGLYDVAITMPYGPATAVPLGYVATLSTSTSNWTLTVVSS